MRSRRRRGCEHASGEVKRDALTTVYEWRHAQATAAAGAAWAVATAAPADKVRVLKLYDGTALEA